MRASFTCCVMDTNHIFRHSIFMYSHMLNKKQQNHRLNDDCISKTCTVFCILWIMRGRIYWNATQIRKKKKISNNISWSVTVIENHPIIILFMINSFCFSLSLSLFSLHVSLVNFRFSLSYNRSISTHNHCKLKDLSWVSNLPQKFTYIHINFLNIFTGLANNLTIFKS